MDLSLREVVHARYGIDGSFSVIKGVVSKLRHGINYYTPDGRVSLRLVLTPPLLPNILSFTASTQQLDPSSERRVDFAWQVEPPTPLFAKNTSVDIGLWDEGYSNYLDELSNLKLSDIYPNFTAPPGTTTYWLLAYTIVQGGISKYVRRPAVVVFPEPPPSPVTPPSSAPVADLVVISSWIEPSEYPQPDQAIRANFILQNFGSAVAGPFTCQIQLDGSESSQDIAVSSLIPQQTYTISWDHDGLPAGEHYFVAILDVYNQVIESDKTNNVGHVGFTVTD